MNVKIDKIDLGSKQDIFSLLYKMLPQQGCIEFQRDEPLKCHKWHQHQNDETLVIIEGGLTFYYDDVTVYCNPGDVIFLPSMKRHQSIASESGCVYAIATEFVDL